MRGRGCGRAREVEGVEAMVWRARSAHAKHKAAYTALRARALLWCACAWGESGWVVKMGDKRTMRWGCARACGAGSVGKGRDAAAAGCMIFHATRPQLEMRTSPVEPTPRMPSSHSTSRRRGANSVGESAAWGPGGLVRDEDAASGTLIAGTGASGILDPQAEGGWPTRSVPSSAMSKSARARDSDEDSKRWVEACDDAVCDDRFDCRLDDRFMPEAEEDGRILDPTHVLTAALWLCCSITG